MKVKHFGKRAVSIGILCIYAVIYASGCSEIDERGRSQPGNIQADTLISTTVSIQPEIEIIQDGYVRTRAKAPRGITRESQGNSKTQLLGPPVYVEVLDSLGRIETRIECNEASYRSQDLRFEFFGDVRVKSGIEENRKLRTERLTWNEELQIFNSKGFVIITTPTDSITGYGFSGTQDLSEYSLRTVSGEFSVE